MNQLEIHNWKRVWARKYAPFLSSTFMRVFQKHEGLNLSKNKLFVPEGNLHAIYFDEIELNKIISKYTDILLRQNIGNYAVWYERQFKDFLSWSKKENKIDFSKNTNVQLSDKIKELVERLVDFSELQFYAFLVLEGPAKFLERTLSDRPDVLAAISTNYKNTKISQGYIELLKLKINGLTDKSLDSYLKKYQWLPMYDFIDQPQSLKDVSCQIDEIKDPENELLSLLEHRKKGLKEYRTFLKTIKDKEFKKLVEVVHHFSFLKEMRDDYRRHAYYLWIPFWNEIGNRLGISREEANFLTGSELQSALIEGSKFQELIKLRQENYAFWLKEGQLLLLSGDEIKQVERLVNTLDSNSEIKGSVASKGKVVGTVRVVYHQGEFLKFNEGDVLVTTMTHPEFLLIMKRSSAIVTDEGGITCHAAIVSRELRKPCIIGTKIATKVLKDGDLVEVDAERGVVKILKKA